MAGTEVILRWFEREKILSLDSKKGVESGIANTFSKVLLSSKEIQEEVSEGSMLIIILLHYRLISAEQALKHEPKLEETDDDIDVCRRIRNLGRIRHCLISEGMHNFSRQLLHEVEHFSN